MKKKPTIDELRLKRAHEMNEVKKWWECAVDALVQGEDDALARAVKNHRNAMARLVRVSEKLTALQRVRLEQNRTQP